MICLNCGKVIDDDTSVCPFCNTFVQDSDASLEFPPEDDAVNAAGPEEFVDDDPGYSVPGEKKGIKIPELPKLQKTALSAQTVISAACALLSLICLIMIVSVKKEISNGTDRVVNEVMRTQDAVYAVNNRLDGLDSTVASVQSEAYNQLASQTISITKDITALTGPVTAGKYNVMFIINVKGNLSVNTSFDWQKYNDETGGWVSIVFTGNATTNDEMGLRLENEYDSKEGIYTSKLWANGITPQAAGSYRCVITDMSGITKNSAEATVQIALD